VISAHEQVSCSHYDFVHKKAFLSANKKNKKNKNKIIFGKEMDICSINVSTLSLLFLAKIK
jgi:hypothetical protein